MSKKPNERCLTMSAIECATARQFIKLVNNHEDKAQELIEKLHEEKSIEEIPLRASGWVVADRKPAKLFCSDEAFELYVKEFVCYLRAFGTNRTCSQYMLRMEDLGLVPRLKMPRVNKKKVVSKVPILPYKSAPERVAEAISKMYKQPNTSVLELPNTFHKEEEFEDTEIVDNDDIFDGMELTPEEAKDFVDEPPVVSDDDDDPPFCQPEERMCTVNVRDLMLLVEYINEENVRRPHGAVSRIMWEIIKTIKN